MLTLLLLGALAVLLVWFAVAVAQRPARFRVERSIVVGAAPEHIATHINDFHSWGPFAGAETGRGSSYCWVGDRTVGHGRMTIQILPADHGSQVTWAMEGENQTFGMKAFAYLINTNDKIGRLLDKQLASMKTHAERAT